MRHGGGLSLVPGGEGGGRPKAPVYSPKLFFYSTQKLAPRSIILCMEASVLPGRVPPPRFVHNVAEVTHPGKTRPQAHRGRREESEASPGLDGGVGCHPRATDNSFSNLHCLHYLHVLCSPGGGGRPMEEASPGLISVKATGSEDR